MKSILWQNEGFDPIAFWVKGVANIELVRILINTQYVIPSIATYPVKMGHVSGVKYVHMEYFYKDFNME